MPTELNEGIEILDYFCPAILPDSSARAGQPDSEKEIYAHPLLVYAELLYSGKERQIEAASQLYEK